MQNFYKYAKFEGDNVNGFYPSQNLLEIFWKGTSMQNLKYVAWTVPEISRAKVSWTAGLVDCRTICKVKQTMLELNDIQLMLHALPVKLCWTFSHTDFYRLYRSIGKIWKMAVFFSKWRPFWKYSTCICGVHRCIHVPNMNSQDPLVFAVERPTHIRTHARTYIHTYTQMDISRSQSDCIGSPWDPI